MQKLLTIKLIALALCLSEVTIKHWAYGHRPAPKGFPQPIRVGRQIRFVEEEFDEWVNTIRGSHGNIAAESAPAPKRRGRPRKTADSVSGVSYGSH